MTTSVVKLADLPMTREAARILAFQSMHDRKLAGTFEVEFTNVWGERETMKL